MPDYAKMKNSELEALLKQRSLPSGGKKADMVARLTEADGAADSAPAATEAKPAATAPPAAAPAAAAASSNDAKPVAAEPAVAAAANTAADGTAEKKAATEPATADGAAAQAEAAPAKPAVDFTTGLAKTSIDEEIARRKKRAAKFGIADEAAETEALKALERQKRFATDGGAGAANAPSGVHGLDEALPERINRKRGRGGEDETAASKDAASLDDPGLKRRRGGGGFRGRGGGRGRGQRRGGGAPGSWMSDADRKAAEARKARFA